MYKSKQNMLVSLILIFSMTIGINSTISAQTYISHNTTWSTNQSGLGDIYIENGATLKITSGVTVSMGQNTRIYVNSGAKLDARGATIETPQGLMWRGICSIGLGSDFDQLGQFNIDYKMQPVIQLLRCILNNMQEGVSNAFNGHSGGILRIRDCEFNNCNIAIRFDQYKHYRQPGVLTRDLSFVRACTFNHAINMQHIPIVLKEVVGVRIIGNTFNNSYIGIFASKAGFTVKDYYSGLPSNNLIAKTRFNNCQTGIKIVNDPNLLNKVVIRDAVFTNVSRSIQALGSDNIEIYSNTIKLDQGFGIYLENCATFNVEDNNISTMDPLTSPVGIRGIIIHNCGSNNNRIYNNTVSNCNYNIVGQEHNRGLDSQSGLQFICNNLDQTSAISTTGTDNSYYMAALTTQPNNPIHGINEWQLGGAVFDDGSTIDISSAYNVIPDRSLTDGDENDFYNEHYRAGFDIAYKNPYMKYPLSQVLESNISDATYDYYSENIWVTEESDGYSNQCPNTVPSQLPTLTTLNDISNQLQAVHIAYTQLLPIIGNYVNNGDYDFMLNQVNNINNSNFTMVYFYLMNNHPSTDIIAKAVANDILPNYMCADILVTNSYGIKSQLVRDALANRQNQLTASQMSSIKTAANSTSQYESYQMQLASLRTQINTLSTAKYNYYFNVDSDVIEVDNVINTLNENKNFYSYVSLMMYYFDLGDLESAMNYYEGALNIKEASDLEKKDLNVLFEILMNVYEGLGGDFAQLDEENISVLEKLSDTESKSGGIAKSILINEFKYDFKPILLSANKKSSMRLAKPINENSNSLVNQMQIIPNPAENFIGISITEDYSFPLNLQIYDITGKLVKQQQLNSLSTIMIDDLKSGVYQVNIIDVNQKRFTQKLIIK